MHRGHVEPPVEVTGATRPGDRRTWREVILKPALGRQEMNQMTAAETARHGQEITSGGWGGLRKRAGS